MTQQTHEAIEAIELNIKQAQEMVNRGAALQRLAKNRDFKEVILNGYLKDEAVRLVHARSNPAMQDEESVKLLTQGMDGIAALLQYFRTLEHSAMLAEKAIEADEQARDELLQEDAE